MISIRGFSIILFVALFTVAFADSFDVFERSTSCDDKCYRRKRYVRSFCPKKSIIECPFKTNKWQCTWVDGKEVCGYKTRRGFKCDCKPKVSATPSVSPTPTVSTTSTATATPTISTTSTASATPTVSTTSTATATPSVSTTSTATATPTRSATPTVSTTSTATATPTSSVTPSRTPSPTASATSTATAKPSKSASPSASASPIKKFCKPTVFKGRGGSLRYVFDISHFNGKLPYNYHFIGPVSLRIIYLGKPIFRVKTYKGVARKWGVIHFNQRKWSRVRIVITTQKKWSYYRFVIRCPIVPSYVR